MILGLFSAYVQLLPIRIWEANEQLLNKLWMHPKHYGLWDICRSTERPLLKSTHFKPMLNFYTSVFMFSGGIEM